MPYVTTILLNINTNFQQSQLYSFLTPKKNQKSSWGIHPNPRTLLVVFILFVTSFHINILCLYTYQHNNVTKLDTHNNKSLLILFQLQHSYATITFTISTIPKLLGISLTHEMLLYPPTQCSTTLAMNYPYVFLSCNLTLFYKLI